MSMKCENCGENPAKVHMTEIVNETEKVERHLCEKCAQKLGYTIPQYSISELLAGIAKSQLAGAKAGAPDVKCDSCGITFAEFQSSGRFGCAEDYDVFEDFLEGSLKRYHDATQHVGKIPPAGEDSRKRAATLRALRGQLREAVAREDYEQAAGLRDEIAGVERSGRGASEGGARGGEAK
jgi:protein arginine kinase activator